jgi:hypothetical protein
MVSSADVIRTTISRFLPVAAVTLAGSLVVITGLHARAGLASLRQVYWPLVAGQPVAISVGYAGALLVLRRQLAPAAIRSPGRTASAAGLAVVGLGVLSVYTQGAGLGRIILYCAVAGAVAGGLLAGASTTGQGHGPEAT